MAVRGDQEGAGEASRQVGPGPLLTELMAEVPATTSSRPPLFAVLAVSVDICPVPWKNARETSDSVWSWQASYTRMLGEVNC